MPKTPTKTPAPNAPPISPQGERCMHCLEHALESQADCTQCGGKVGRQCCHKDCNKRPAVKHDYQKASVRPEEDGGLIG